MMIFVHKHRCTCYSFGFCWWPLMFLRWCGFWMAAAALRRAFYLVSFFPKNRDEMINDLRKSLNAFEDFRRFHAEWEKKRNHQYRSRFVGNRVGLNLCWLFENEIVAIVAWRIWFGFWKRISFCAPLFIRSNFPQRTKTAVKQWHTATEAFHKHSLCHGQWCRIWPMIFAPKKKYRTESIVSHNMFPSLSQTINYISENIFSWNARCSCQKRCPLLRVFKMFVNELQ